MSANAPARKSQDAGHGDTESRREKLFFLLLDKLVIGLLIVLATLAANWVLDRHRAEEEAARYRDRARGALTAEFAKARTDRVVPVLQAQVRSNATLERVRVRLVEFSKAHKKEAAARKNHEDADTSFRAARRSFRQSDRSHEELLVLRSSALRLRSALARWRQAILLLQHASARLRTPILSWQRAVLGETRLLIRNSFWLGSELETELQGHLKLHDKALGKATDLLRCITTQPRITAPECDVTAINDTVDTLRASEGELDINAILDAFSQGA